MRRRRHRREPDDMAMTCNETTGNDRTAATTVAPTQAIGVIRTALHSA